MLTGILMFLSYLGLNNGFNLDPSAAMLFNGPEDSYFGFSVSLHRNSKGDWLLAGAPKANPIFQESFNSSGALFMCGLHRGATCTQVKLDDKGNENTAIFIKQGKSKIRLKFKDRKDKQWLGASIDSHQNEEGAVVVCAHRWADTRYREYIFANGACWEINGELEFNSTQRHIALTKRALQIMPGYGGKPNVYLYAYGQQGISAHYTQDGEKLLVGAPGIRDWTGGVIEYYEESFIVGKPETTLPKNGYLGYAVSSGKFYDHETAYYVSGGPKIDLVGKVLVYIGGFDIRAELSGHQFGEYFGAALCVADLNNDGFDDLLVGAPHYKHKSYDEGRVAVFIMRHTHMFEHVFDLLGSEKPGARFGSAITTGDLNQDGHPDIIVGAPYEDEHGAIYVYSGHRHGLYSTYSQRIGARDIDPSIRGFGYALSKPKPRHGQHYPDIPVGAYASNQAVLIPARPVVALRMNSESKPSIIKPTVATCSDSLGQRRTCLGVGVAFDYSGDRLPSGLSFKVTAKSDITRRTGDERDLPVRAMFRNKTNPDQLFSDIAEIVEDLPSGTLHECLFILVLDRNIRDIITPLSISVEIELLDTKVNDTELPPLLDVHRPRQMVLPIPFEKNCGPDNHCSTDLELSTSILWPSSHEYIILGKKDLINLQLTVKNLGEKAYLSGLVVQYSTDLQFVGIRRNSNKPSGIHISCIPHASEDYVEEHSHAELICEIGNPINENMSKTLTVAFYRQVKHHFDEFVKDEVVVNVYTTTRSNETNLENNNATIRLPVKISADMTFSGVSEPEQHIYELKEPAFNTSLMDNTTALDVTQGIMEIKHVYDLRNNGPGLFPGGYLEVQVPTQARGLHLAEYEVEIVKEPDDRDDDFTYAVEPEDRKKRDVMDGSDTVPVSSDDKKRNDLPSAEPLFGRRQADPLAVDCNLAACKTRHYYVGPLGNGKDTVINIRLWLDVDNLTSLQDLGVVAYSTHVTLPGHFLSEYPHKVQLKVTTLVTPRRIIMPEIQIPWWVIAASIGVGVFLLFIVVVILYRFGFFTRREREELAKLIDQNEENEENETRMMQSSDNATEDWQGYDPWQPQNTETNLLIWHANGSISHNSRDEYLAATHRNSGTSFDRNLNEKGRFSHNGDVNGGFTPHPQNQHFPPLHHRHQYPPEVNGRVRYPSDSLPPPVSRDPRSRHHGSTMSDGEHPLGSHFNRRSYNEDDFYRRDRIRPPSDSHSYLVIQPDVDSDEERAAAENALRNRAHINR